MKSGRILSILALLAIAATLLQPVMAETADNATMYYNRGSQSASAGSYDRAVEFFDMALAENLTSVSKSDTLMYIYKDKAAALTDLGRYDDAIATADKGIALYPKEPGLWNNKGYAYFRLGKYTEAVDAYDRATTIDPKYLKGWINKGIALNKAGRPYEAITAFNKALEIDPGNSDATSGLKEAQGATMSTNIALAAIVIVALGLVIWYVKFRTPADAKGSAAKKDKKAEKE